MAARRLSTITDNPSSEVTLEVADLSSDAELARVSLDAPRPCQM
jgi:hypothetical protein